MDRTILVAWASLLVSLVVLATKTEAYRLTGSVALYSDALETIINVATALAALFALWYSARPADTNHPYGHDKAEYLSAIVEGALVLATAFVILNAAFAAWNHPVPVHTPLRGIALNAAAGLVNLVWALVLLREGRRLHSPALAAGGRHVMTDVWTTVAVLAGFALVPLTGWLRLDAVVAAVVALNILRTGWAVLRNSVGGLMDEVQDPDMVTTIRGAIGRSGGGAIEAHDVRLRVAGRMTFVDFHLVVPSDMTVDAAHVICDRIERAIRDEVSRDEVGRATITIHVEPGYKTKPTHDRADALLLARTRP